MQVFIDFGSKYSIATGVAIQSDSKIIVTGLDNVESEYIIARFTEDGCLDKSFNPQGEQPGVVRGNFYYGAGVTGVIVQEDNKIVIAGYGSSIFYSSFAIARYLEDGMPDITFNPKGPQPGTILTRFNNGSAQALAITLQKDGKIIAVGRDQLPSLQVKFALARYTINGSLDTFFNPKGVQPGTVTTSFGGSGIPDDEAYSVALQADGKIIVGGYTYSLGGFKSFALARYKGASLINL